MSDLIDRQAAIDAITAIDDGFNCDIYTNEVREILRELPSVPERKKGRWVDCVGSDHWRCSKCGDRAPMYWDANRQEYDEWFSPYCPNCGCAMTEGAEDAEKEN